MFYFTHKTNFLILSMNANYSLKILFDYQFFTISNKTLICDYSAVYFKLIVKFAVEQFLNRFSLPNVIQDKYKIRIVVDHWWFDCSVTHYVSFPMLKCILNCRKDQIYSCILCKINKRIRNKLGWICFIYNTKSLVSHS